MGQREDILAGIKRWEIERGLYTGWDEAKGEVVDAEVVLVEDIKSHSIYEPIKYKWKMGGCNRCGGSMNVKYNELVEIEECLQCGNQITVRGTESAISRELGVARQTVYGR